MPHRFTIARSLYPPASLLGRLVQRWARDARHAESLYLFTAALVLCVGMIAGQWGWMLWGTTPDGSPSLAFAGVQGAGALLFVAGGLLGWRPRTIVTVRAHAFDVRQGTAAVSVPWERLRASERISAAAYHRHWRRYAATRAFVGRLPDQLLLLRTESGPVVVGLAPADLDTVEALVAEHCDACPSRQLASAA